jgi:hypothetical protein
VNEGNNMSEAKQPDSPQQPVPNSAAPERPEPAARPAPVPPAPARTTLDQILRGADLLLARVEGADAARVIVRLAAIAVIGFLVYGVVLGSFSGGDQWWASPAKVLIGAVLCATICFPSLYIFASLAGADARATHVLGMLLGTLASTAILLAGFAPVAWIFSQSSSTVSLLAPIHLIVWLISFLASQRILSAGLRRWRGRPSALTGLWASIFLVTSLQMMTTLRPLLGHSDGFRFHDERKFFLVHWADTIVSDADSPTRK